MYTISEMKLPRFSRFLLSLSLFISPGVLSATPALTNIHVTCHNFKNVLSWNYSEPDLQPEFNIKINGYGSDAKYVRTSQTYLDISEYTQDVTNTYYITVEAQPKGSELNKSSDGISFSYSEDFSSDVTCVVDFPVLEVSVLPRVVELSFSHPFNVYNVPSLNDQFSYIVVFNQTRSKGDCYSDDEKCTAVLHLTESLYGTCLPIRVQGAVKSIPTETETEVCGNYPVTEPDWAVITIVLVCCVAAFVFLIILAVVVYIKLTRPESQSTIVSKLLRKVNSDQGVHVPEEAHVSEVISIGEAPLLGTCDPALSNSSSHVSPSIPTHIPIQFNPDIRPSEDEDDNEGSDSGGFDSGNSFSGYDSQKFPIDMGQGDIVEAYGPR